VNLGHGLAMLGSRAAAGAEPAARANAAVMTSIEQIGLHSLLSTSEVLV